MSLVESFITHYNVDINRTESGSYDNDSGKWVNGATTVFKSNLCIQPANQKDRLLLPEAVRDSQIIKIYHNDEVFITNDRTRVKGDFFTYNSNNYQFISTSDWKTGNYDILFYKSFAIMMDKTGSYDN